MTVRLDSQFCLCECVYLPSLSRTDTSLRRLATHSAQEWQNRSSQKTVQLTICCLPFLKLSRGYSHGVVQLEQGFASSPFQPVARCREDLGTLHTRTGVSEVYCPSTWNIRSAGSEVLLKISNSRPTPPGTGEWRHFSGMERKLRRPCHRFANPTTTLSIDAARLCDGLKG